MVPTLQLMAQTRISLSESGREESEAVRSLFVSRAASISSSTKAFEGRSRGGGEEEEEGGGEGSTEAAGEASSCSATFSSIDHNQMMIMKVNDLFLQIVCDTTRFGKKNNFVSATKRNRRLGRTGLPSHCAFTLPLCLYPPFATFRESPSLRCFPCLLSVLT